MLVLIDLLLLGLSQCYKLPSVLLLGYFELVDAYTRLDRVETVLSLIHLMNVFHQVFWSL